jgi:plastocyanin
MRHAPCLLIAILLCWTSAAAAHASGDIEGRIELALDGLAVADIGPIVVYLEIDAELGQRAPAAHHRIKQKGARFSSELIPVGAGQTVEFFNDDSILHNVFSYSKTKPFDLGLARAGSSREVTFERPGVVQVYCSIHAGMNATIFVAPSAFYAAIDATGTFALRGVPAGRHRLRSWSAKLPDSNPTAVSVADGQTTRIVVRLGAE